MNNAGMEVPFTAHSSRWHTKEDQLYHEVIRPFMRFCDNHKDPIKAGAEYFAQREAAAEKAAYELCRLETPNIWKLIHIMQYLPSCRKKAWESVVKHHDEKEIRMVFWHCRKWNVSRGHLVPRVVVYEKGIDVSELAGKWLLKHCTEKIKNIGVYVPSLAMATEARIRKLQKRRVLSAQTTRTQTRSGYHSLETGLKMG